MKLSFPISVENVHNLENLSHSPVTAQNCSSSALLPSLVDAIFTIYTRRREKWYREPIPNYNFFV